MELVVLPSKTEEVGLKLDNLLGKLNTRIMEKVDECNDLLDKIQFSSDEDVDLKTLVKLINTPNDIAILRIIAKDLINEYNKRKSRTGDGELSENNSAVSE